MLKRSSRYQPMPPPVGTPPDPDTVSEPEATTEADNSNWDSFTTLVHTAAQATPTKCTSTVATQTDDEALDGGPLWLLLSATDGLNGSTQVTHTEQVDERDPQAHKGSCHVVEHLARFLHGCKEPHKPLFVYSPGDLAKAAARAKQHAQLDARFKRDFLDRSFGHSCKVCDRLWFDNNLTRIGNIRNETHRTNALSVLCNEFADASNDDDGNADGKSKTDYNDYVVCASCKDSLIAGRVPATIFPRGTMG
ncbi:hypothetical protein HPB47_001999 [Ixodes persulcatus]|uniref:Uncharacterized protein n=1 Tax=Ixodes persulcatus TaxID=34615 RepID=A0AC60PNM3_IXOPE|nr:hypothetical protein HPB47_001999 [Ixodes persulcatus]